ncbi:MAG: hypothetical protein ACYDGR_09895 [Candidatus Dormibacteria bacterium]
MSAPQVRCPSCGSTSGLATVETVYYHAPIAIKDGEVVFTDASARIFWETSETQVAPDGDPLIHCHDCDHEWAEARLRAELRSVCEAA